MRDEFLMGRRDHISRSDTTRERLSANSELRERLVRLSISNAFNYFSEKLGYLASLDEQVVSRVSNQLAAAGKIGVFARRGGVNRADFISLAVLAEVMQPKLYVESGVFVGSSLYAFHSSAHVERIYAFDPDLGNLLFRDDDPARTAYIDDADFSEHAFEEPLDRALIYFDDHINSARRIIESAEKGFKTLVFDDSFGVGGLTQQRYPAFPTVPLIMNVESFRAGDAIEWTFTLARHVNVPLGIARPISQVEITGKRFQLMRAEFTEAVLDEMRRARDLVADVVPFPRLDHFVVEATKNAPSYAEKRVVVLR